MNAQARSWRAQQVEGVRAAKTDELELRSRIGLLLEFGIEFPGVGHHGLGP